MKIFLRFTLFIAICTGITACGGKDKDGEVVTAPPEVIYKTDTSKSVTGKPDKPPVINITDTLTVKRIVLVMKDSAKTSERIGSKMSDIYNKILPDIIEKQKLEITGPRIAWYKSSSPPFFFEAGITVNKKPAGKLPKNVYIKNINSDSAIVAHFYGPYTLTFQAYEALNEYMKDYKRKASAPPFEVYIDNMYDANGKPVDPYKVRTDIVYPRK